MLTDYLIVGNIPYDMTEVSTLLIATTQLDVLTPPSHFRSNSSRFFLQWAQSLDFGKISGFNAGSNQFTGSPTFS
jgi:hypothetical protein